MSTCQSLSKSCAQGITELEAVLRWSKLEVDTSVHKYHDGNGNLGTQWYDLTHAGASSSSVGDTQPPLLPLSDPNCVITIEDSLDLANIAEETAETPMTVEGTFQDRRPQGATQDTAMTVEETFQDKRPQGPTQDTAEAPMTVEETFQDTAEAPIYSMTTEEAAQWSQDCQEQCDLMFQPWDQLQEQEQERKEQEQELQQKQEQERQEKAQEQLVQELEQERLQQQQQEQHQDPHPVAIRTFRGDGFTVVIRPKEGTKRSIEEMT